jgi:hypothetical protein
MTERVIINLEPPNPRPGTLVRVTLQRAQSAPCLPTAPVPQVMRRTQSERWDTSAVVDPCPICFYRMNAQGDLADFQLKCGHTYHLDCLAEWAKINQTCPECRRRISRRRLSLLGITLPQRRRARETNHEDWPCGELTLCCCLSGIMGTLLGSVFHDCCPGALSGGGCIGVTAAVPVGLFIVTKAVQWRTANQDQAP